MTQHRYKTLRYAFLLWAVASLLQAFVLTAQEHLFFGYALASSALYYGLLALAAIPVWRVTAWLSATRRPLAFVLGVHIAMAAAVFAVWQAAYFAYLNAVIGSLEEVLGRNSMLWQVLGALTAYAVMLATIIATQAGRRLEAQRERQAELEVLAREAEIRALKVLIRPHFFFNVMNSIYSLIETRPREAQNMVELVADLMRQTLDAADEDFVTLDWELKAVETYLEIEKIRFGDRLTVKIVRNGASPDSYVPPFLLQPLVENAIKHGIAAQSGSGEVSVGVHTVSGSLEFTVSDTGRGLPDSAMAEGHGLSILRRRLENLYGNEFAIERRNLNPNGFTISVRIPCGKSEYAAGHV